MYTLYTTADQPSTLQGYGTLSAMVKALGSGYFSIRIRIINVDHDSVVFKPRRVQCTHNFTSPTEFTDSCMLCENIVTWPFNETKFAVGARSRTYSTCTCIQSEALPRTCSSSPACPLLGACFGDSRHKQGLYPDTWIVHLQ